MISINKNFNNKYLKLILINKYLIILQKKKISFNLHYSLKSKMMMKNKIKKKKIKINQQIQNKMIINFKVFLIILINNNKAYKIVIVKIMIKNNK